MAAAAYLPYSNTPISIYAILLAMEYSLDKNFPKVCIFTDMFLAGG